MQTGASVLNALPFLMVCGAVYGIAWVLWKFYRALARIGDELGEIKMELRLRLPPLERRGDL
jgi:hypothetical protein